MSEQRDLQIKSVYEAFYGMFHAHKICLTSCLIKEGTIEIPSPSSQSHHHIHPAETTTNGEGVIHTERGPQDVTPLSVGDPHEEVVELKIITKT